MRLRRRTLGEDPLGELIATERERYLYRKALERISADFRAHHHLAGLTARIALREGDHMIEDHRVAVGLPAVPR